MSVNYIRDFLFENYYGKKRIFKGKQLLLKKKFKKRFIVTCKKINRKNT